jgi:transcriptional regulator with XRE-family HTH domain
MATLRTVVTEQLKKLGVTQKELAEKAGLTPTYINELVTGKKLTIQRRFVEKLAHALEIEPDVLYEKTGRAKKNTAVPTSTPTRRTIIRSGSPLTRTPFSHEMDFQTVPKPQTSVPLLLNAFAKSSRFKNYPFVWEELYQIEALAWPKFLGPAKGCYAITADALNVEVFFTDSVLLVAPGSSIKSGDYFVGTFSYKTDTATLELHKMLDATEREFILVDAEGREKRVPRTVIKQLHRVVGLFEQPD